MNNEVKKQLALVSLVFLMGTTAIVLLFNNNRTEAAPSSTLPWVILVAVLMLGAIGTLLFSSNSKKEVAEVSLPNVTNTPSTPKKEQKNNIQDITQVIMNTSDDPILILDNDKRIQACNMATSTVFGYSKEELSSIRLNVLVDEQEEGNKGLRKDGSTFPIRLKITESNAGGNDFYTVRIKDLTEEQKSKEEFEERALLVENQNWLKTAIAEVFNSTKGVTDLGTLINSITNVVCKQLDVGVGIFYLNQELFQKGSNELRLTASYAFQKRKGLANSYIPGEGLIGQCALEKKTIIVSDVPDNYIQIVSGIGNTTPREIVATPIMHEEELIGVMELGILRTWNQLQLEFIDEVTKSIGIIIKGVIERSKTEELAIEVNNQMQAINRSNAAIEFDLEGYILTANELFLKLMGYTLSEVVGKHHGIFVEPEYRESAEYKNFWKELGSGEFKQGEFKRYNKNGNDVYIQGSYNPILGTDGKPYKVLKVAVDVTEQKAQQIKTEELGVEITNQMQAINRSNASIEFDMKGNILFANDLFLDLMGYQLEEIVGVHHSIFVSEEYKASKEYAMFWDELQKGAFTQGEFHRFDKAGNDIWIQGSYNPILGLDQKPYKILKIAVDITAQKTFMLQLNEQNEKLEAQEEELRISNEELQLQADKLKNSEEQLRVQQEELASTNAELEEKASLLEEQNQSITEQNEALEQARQALEIKAAEIEESDKYKSEFLANMSHELRTPLNSILILSKFLHENKEQNMSEKQIEYAKVINSSGSDLLNLINEVLDLAKVESGKIELEVQKHKIESIANENINNIKGLAINKDIDLTLHIDDQLPPAFVTDKQRLNQIIKNLMSNAIKFTDNHGTIKLAFEEVSPNNKLASSTLIKSDKLLKISVTDSGIGIPEDKLNIIFQAFKQADGSTHRKYGGTGLGLSISKELAQLLGGELIVESEVGKGSCFSVFLPLNQQESKPQVNGHQPKLNGVNGSHPTTEEEDDFLDWEASSLEGVIADDRENIEPADQVLLIVEDDLSFAKVLLDMAREQGFKGLVTDQGDLALKHVKAYQPNAIILDMQLPVMDGWTVLKKLKTSQYSDIPVHIMSGMDKKKLGLELGAVEYLVKPIDPDILENTFNSISANISKSQPKNIVFIEDNPQVSELVTKTLRAKGIEVHEAHNGTDGLELMDTKNPDLVILDLGLPDMDGMDVFKKVKEAHSNMPIIVFTAEELSQKDLKTINKEKNASVVLKSHKSMDRLLEETELFVHSLKNGSEYSLQKMKIKNFEENNILSGKRMLVVDDDMRNIYALETILDNEGVEIVVASNGQEAVDEMSNPDNQFDAVLMDIMMPVMDGYEATREIRKLGFDKLPIIALTAKAMKGDREKCLEAGVSDYLTKPLDVEQLLSLLRVWLYK